MPTNRASGVASAPLTVIRGPTNAPAGNLHQRHGCSPISRPAPPVTSRQALTITATSKENAQVKGVANVVLRRERDDWRVLWAGFPP